MRNEFRLLSRLSPLISVHLRKSYSNITICTDACLSGEAVVLMKAPVEVVRRVSGMNLLEREEWIKGTEWQTSICHKWRLEVLIYVLEFEALIH